MSYIVWTLRHYVEFCIPFQIYSCQPWISFRGHHNTTFKVSGGDLQVFQNQNFKVLNIDGVSTKSLQRCLLSSPETDSLKVRLSQECRRIHGQGLWTASHQVCDGRDYNDYFGYETLLLWGTEHNLLSLTFHLQFPTDCHNHVHAQIPMVFPITIGW